MNDFWMGFDSLFARFRDAGDPEQNYTMHRYTLVRLGLAVTAIIGFTVLGGEYCIAFWLFGWIAGSYPTVYVGEVLGTVRDYGEIQFGAYSIGYLACVYHFYC